EPRWSNGRMYSGLSYPTVMAVSPQKPGDGRPTGTGAAPRTVEIVAATGHLPIRQAEGRRAA
ncbi:MAG TPA: hypothetical protein VJ739_20000, partial [Gemmataceae bacterium]|nr:hypothetical protein [Gemmataceae bacterium]